jgi:hypothetical protein
VQDAALAVRLERAAALAASGSQLSEWHTRVIDTESLLLEEYSISFALLISNKGGRFISEITTRPQLPPVLNVTEKGCTQRPCLPLL